MTYEEKLIHEREMYVAKVLSREKLKERWKRIGYQPQPKQLSLQFN